MNKLFTTFLLLLLLGIIPVRAESPFEFMDLKNPNATVLFDFISQDVYVGADAHVFGFKNLLYLDAGVITNGGTPTEIAFSGGVSVDLKTLAEMLKLAYFPGKTIGIGLGYGRDFRNKKNLFCLYASKKI